MIPISRLVAVSLSPASSVLSRTLARTGSVLRFDTARLTTDRPRARFSCMTESFTSGSLHVAWADRRRGSAGSCGRRSGSAEASGRPGDRAWSVVVGIFSLSSHPVITVVMVWNGGPPRSAPHGSDVDDRRRPVDGTERRSVAARRTDGGRPGGRPTRRPEMAPDRPRRAHGDPAERAADVHRRPWFSTDSARLSTRGRSSGRCRRTLRRPRPRRSPGAGQSA